MKKYSLKLDILSCLQYRYKKKIKKRVVSCTSHNRITQSIILFNCFFNQQHTFSLFFFFNLTWESIPIAVVLMALTSRNWDSSLNVHFLYLSHMLFTHVSPHWGSNSTLACGNRVAFNFPDTFTRLFSRTGNLTLTIKLNKCCYNFSILLRIYF